MEKIKQIQTDFREALLENNAKAIINHIRPSQIRAEFRLSIYRNTVNQSLYRALENTFPAIWQLVGKECADSVAFAFLQDEKHFPTTPCLDDWGEKFPIFLHTIQSLKHLVYLKDIATIEWLQHLSYCAEDYHALEPAALEKYEPQNLDELELLFNPSVFLYSSAYTLKTIFDFVAYPEQYEQVELELTPSYVVITRQHNRVWTHWISQELYDFFNYVKTGTTLVQANAYLFKINPSFNLVGVLEFMLRTQLLC